MQNVKRINGGRLRNMTGRSGLPPGVLSPHNSVMCLERRLVQFHSVP